MPRYLDLIEVNVGNKHLKMEMMRVGHDCPKMGRLQKMLSGNNYDVVGIVSGRGESWPEQSRDKYNGHHRVNYYKVHKCSSCGEEYLIPMQTQVERNTYA